MSRVGIDLDGVCYDFNLSLRFWLETIKGAKLNYAPSVRWEFYEDWGLSLEEFLRECNRAADAGHLFRHGPVLNDAKAQLERLRDAGHTIVLITDRNFGESGKPSRDHTSEWLFENEIPYDEIHFTSNKSSVEVDFHIDDKPQNVVEMANAGVDAWMLDCPWNHDVYLSSIFKRVPDLKTFVDYVLTRTMTNGGSASSVPKPHVYDPDRELVVPASKITFNPTDILAQIHETQGEIRKVSSTGGAKGSKLARFDLIPEDVMWKLAELYGRGALKYEPRNWERGYDWSLSYAAARRHMALFWQGEDFDKHAPECAEDCVLHTGAHHLVCAMFHLAALVKFGETHPEFDDRP